ncbi:MAG: CapA family protein [Chthonomonadales bacterium]|nr:CapA family protein [Chthonomonadales bacterium]
MRRIGSFLGPAALLAAGPCWCAPVRVVAVGDICLSGSVARRMAAAGQGCPFAAVAPTLRGADIALGNLECALAAGGQPLPKRFRFRGSPGAAAALRAAGFDALSLANNHSLDFGREGLRETLAAVRAQGMLALGADETLAGAHRLRVVRVRGVRVGLLAYLGMFPAPLAGSRRAPSVAMADLGPLGHHVRAARKRVNMLIVSMHAGVERARTPSARQRAVARAAIDAGADVVIGHHPHVVQPLEYCRGRPIFYSLGNFVFPPSPTFLREAGRGWSAMAVLDLEPGRPARARLASLRIVGVQPRLLAAPRRAGGATAPRPEVGPVWAPRAGALTAHAASVRSCSSSGVGEGPAPTGERGLPRADRGRPVPEPSRAAGRSARS